MKKFEAFKKTLTSASLKAIYDETRLEVANDHVEGTEAFSVELASQMAVNLLETYHNWLKEEK